MGIHIPNPQIRVLFPLLPGQRAIHVVAFDALSVMWREPSKLLARTVAVVFNYLIAKTKICPELFASRWCREFGLHLMEVSPTFTLVSDGDLQEHGSDVVSHFLLPMGFLRCLVVFTVILQEG